MLNICSAKFDFMNDSVSAFISSVYHVLKDIPGDKIEFETVNRFKFVYTCGCVFFMYGVVYDFVC